MIDRQATEAVTDPDRRVPTINARMIAEYSSGIVKMVGAGGIVAYPAGQRIGLWSAAEAPPECYEGLVDPGLDLVDRDLEDL